MLARYTLRELRNAPRFALLFVLNLTLGLLGFIALDAIKRNFDERLTSSARTLMGSDLTMGARRPITDGEKEAARSILPPGSETQDVTSLFSMAAAGDRTQLVEIRAIDSSYPYYGEIKLQGHPSHRDAPSLKDKPELWIAGDLTLQLELKPGSTLRIGTMDFTVADVIVEDVATSVGSASMAPRVYMGRNWIEPAGLMAKGNTARHSVMIKLPPGQDERAVEKLIRTKLPDPSLRINSYHNDGDSTGRLLGYLSDYLGLVALVALALAGIGSAYLYRDFFERRMASVAILISLGLSHTRALAQYVIQICFLGAISAGLSSLIALGIIPFFANILQQFSPVAVEIRLPALTVVVAFLLGIFGSLLLCLPLLARLRKLNPSSLFHEQSEGFHSLNAKELILYLPSLIVFYLLAIWQANSIKVGSLFFVLFLVIFGGFALLAWLFLQFVKRFRRSRFLPLRIASVFLRSHPASTISAFVAIGLGATLINLIPQLQTSLMKELENPAGRKLPSFFMFDIQEDQVEGLTEVLSDNKVQPQTVSAMITARLIKVNGETFTRKENDDSVETRESQREEGSRNRGVNLSYRSALSYGESLKEGEFFKGPYGGEGPGEISLEANYADRLGIEIGDTMTFDVQGLEIEGKVTSIRNVKWNTFEPNFFILMQPGLIDDAPKTFLMNIPDLAAEEKVKVQLAVVRAYPNVSIIDVTTLIAKVMEIVGQMALVLNVMAYLTVLTGLLVIYSIAQHQALARRWDHNLLKILGVDFPLLLKASALEFVSVSGLAALLGAGIGLGASLVVSKVLFKGIWYGELVAPAVITVLLVGICLLTAVTATLRILSSRPELRLES